MSTASMQSFKFGCAVRMAHMIEYTSAPLLAANTAIFKVEPKQFTRRHMRSNSARFRRKKVPKDCLLSTWRQTIECKCPPYALPSELRRTNTGRQFQIRRICDK